MARVVGRERKNTEDRELCNGFKKREGRILSRRKEESLHQEEEGEEGGEMT